MPTFLTYLPPIKNFNKKTTKLLPGKNIGAFWQVQNTPVCRKHNVLATKFKRQKTKFVSPKLRSKISNSRKKIKKQGKNQKGLKIRSS